jgi:hypothetical protein
LSKQLLGLREDGYDGEGVMSRCSALAATSTRSARARGVMHESCVLLTGR